MENRIKLFVLISVSLVLTSICWAAEENAASSAKEPSQQILALPSTIPNRYFDPLNYTLGPEDAVEVTVMRHPEFSGIFPVNLEGKIQFKFAGDIDVTGLTKKQLEDKIKAAISAYVINPQVNITVLEYNSKVIYVLGEVGAPGKYNMKADTITVREAVVNAGLPLTSAAMRKCRIITPDKGGRAKVRSVDLYSVLYGGNLRYNYEMHAGDVLYVPCTIMAKIIRIINPVTAVVSGTASGPTDAGNANTAVKVMTGRP